MNESELLEAILGFNEIALSSMMYYLSIVSGYLMAAYVVGKTLTSRKAIYISLSNILF